MNFKVPENLKLEIIDNQVTNTEQILRELMKVDNTDFLKKYHEILEKNPSLMHYEDTAVIAAAAKSRLNIIEQKQSLNNQLEDVKKENANLEGITIMESLKHKNDSERDLYYLKYTDELGETHVLEIDNPEKLSILIASAKKGMDSKAFYKSLINSHFKELKKQNIKPVDKYEEENHVSIIDRENFDEEYRMIEAYAKLNMPNIVPKISIDSHNERIYYVDQTIIKFHTEKAKRKMEIISKDYQKENTKQNNVNQANNTETSYSEQNEEITREEVENRYADQVEAKPVIQKFITNKEITREETVILYSYLLDILSREEQGFELDDVENYFLSASVEHINNNEPTNNIEAEIASRADLYNKELETKKEEKEKNTDDYKVKVYQRSNNPLNVNDNGETLVIIIITVTVLLGALIAAILLLK